MGASVSQRSTTDDVTRLSFAFRADESSAGSFMLKDSETMLHTVHSTLLSKTCCAMDRWVDNRCTSLFSRGVPACLPARPACVQLLLQPVVVSREDTGLAGTPRSGRSRSVRQHMGFRSILSEYVSTVLSSDLLHVEFLFFAVVIRWT